MELGRRLPDPFDRPLRREELPDVPGRTHVALRDDRTCAHLDEARCIVVDPLLGLLEGSFGQARFGIAARVAEVVEEHDRVRRKADARLHERALAEVLVRSVVDAGDGVQAEAVLGGGGERITVAARPAVAVTEVHDDRGAIERFLDRRPGRVRGVDPDDVAGVLAGDGRRLVASAL